MLAIARYAGENGRAYPSVATLSADTCLNPKTIYKALGELKFLGLLSIEKRDGGGNAYMLRLTSKNSTTESSTTENGTTENGTTKNGSGGIPKTEVGVFQKRNATATKNGTRIKQEHNNEQSNEESSNAHRASRAAQTHLFSLDSLPEGWRAYCQQVRPDLDPEQVFLKFRFYWLEGNGGGKRRSDKGWAQSWQNWIRGEKEVRRPAQAPVPQQEQYRSPYAEPSPEVKARQKAQQERAIRWANYQAALRRQKQGLEVPKSMAEWLKPGYVDGTETGATA